MGGLRKKIIQSLPFGDRLWAALCVTKIIFAYPSEAGFLGWDMFTPHFPPWKADGTICRNFNAVNNSLIDLVRSDQFILSFTCQSQEVEKEHFLASLQWRHYNIFWSINFAIGSTGSGRKNFVECGVLDGVGTYFAMESSIAEKINGQKFYLYDSWEGMKGEYLTESEKGKAGEYSYLEVGRTISNLKDYKNITVFNQGFLPDSLKHSENPDDLVWMHIDLNSAGPTLGVLEYFYDRIPQGGVVLLDDYGWAGYEDTRKVVDAFFADKKGTLLPLPTGQAIYFKLG